jgi:hypothetical protein
MSRLVIVLFMIGAATLLDTLADLFRQKGESNTATEKRELRSKLRFVIRSCGPWKRATRHLLCSYATLLLPGAELKERIYDPSSAPLLPFYLD